MSDDKTLRALQTDVHARWGSSDYNPAFQADARPHRDFAHALLHVGIAHGRCLPVLDALEHEDPLEVATREREGVAKRAADMVICAMQMCAAYPDEPIDLQTAYESRMAEKFPSVKARFETLLARWKVETTDGNGYAGGQAFRGIVAMGAPAMPLILAEIDARPSWLVLALPYITSAFNPDIGIPKAIGLVQDICDAWIVWGRTNGWMP